MNKYFFSPSAQGFYADSIDYPFLPDDIVELTEDEYKSLIHAMRFQKKEAFLDEHGELALRDKATPPITWDNIKTTRNRLLKKSDYTQMPDWPGDKQAWAEYRQLLRDIPQTYANPGDVIWPTSPGE